MWTRIGLKTKAKIAFNRNYWKCVLVGLLTVLIVGGSAGISNGGTVSKDVNDLLQSGAAAAAMRLVFSAVAIGGVISAVIGIFLRNPLTVGCSRFFFLNTDEAAEVGEAVFAFRENRYLKVVVADLMKNIFIFLYSLLFLIPGIIKAYDYYLVDYILAEEPTLEWREALDRSRIMMRGHRWNTFVLNLSFLPWILLSALTFGIVGVFYTVPYTMQTDAELYRTLKEME